MKIVFLDRDGVINFNRENHVKLIEEFILYSNAINSIIKLNNEGFKVFVISNQRIIEDEHIPEEKIIKIFDYMQRTVELNGGKIEKYYFCPHSKFKKPICSCRKPNPGLLLKASKEFNLNLSKCYLIGDKISDIEAGKKVNCFSILVKTGGGKEQISHCNEWSTTPDKIFKDIDEAVNFIIRREREHDISRKK